MRKQKLNLRKMKEMSGSERTKKFLQSPMHGRRGGHRGESCMFFISNPASFLVSDIGVPCLAFTNLSPSI
jgi:hypothetical protein